MKQNMQRNNRKKGLTLIELLIVIVLLGVLSTLVAGNLMTSLKRGRDARRKGDLNGIAKALEVYNADFGSYPPSSTDYKITGCNSVLADPLSECNWGEEFSLIAPGNNKVVYMAKLPTDPSGSSYTYISDGSKYGLFTKLENPDDPENITNGASCGSDYCNYGTTSVNTTIEAIAPVPET